MTFKKSQLTTKLQDFRIWFALSRIKFFLDRIDNGHF